MSTELSSPQHAMNYAQHPVVVSGELHCALTGVAVHPEEAYWAPPLITTSQLVATLFHTLTTAPGGLGQVLLGELPNVPYAPAAREQLAARRSAEQLKLVGLLLLIAALLVVPLVLIVT